MGACSVFGVLLVLLSVAKSDGAHGHHHRHVWRKLFVFGDSYVDTGNIEKPFAVSWKTPYGISFPGKPTGRFSDGRVLTDFIAANLRTKSPVPYKARRFAGSKRRFGMNFAYGGTGVFDTLAKLPNMTTQIDMFKRLIEHGEYSKKDLVGSIALVSVSGNDYGSYLARNGTLEGLSAFVGLVVNQTAQDIERILSLGVSKVAVVGLSPVGCLPVNTVTISYTSCVDANNQLAVYHNRLLGRAVADINGRPGGSSSWVTLLDLYTSFMSAMKDTKFRTPLKPCCTGLNSTAGGCGNSDPNGKPLYRLCRNPGSSLFWDGVHPTQAGWSTIIKPLLPTLRTLL